MGQVVVCISDTPTAQEHAGMRIVLLENRITIDEFSVTSLQCVCLAYRKASIHTEQKGSL